MPIKYDDDGRIKRPGKKIEFDGAMLTNYAKCIQDAKFFAEQFYYVVHQITGAQLIKLRDYQEEILNNFQDNRLNILMAARQCGKCVTEDTIITVLNTDTGDVFDITIKDFLILSEKESMLDNQTEVYNE